MGTVVGLDVHKDTIAAAAIDDRASVHAEAVFDNTRAGHHLLANWIMGLEPTRVGLEPSGGVGHGAATRLLDSDVEVVLVPPRLSAREARRLPQRGKCDPADAIAIARVVLREHRLPPFRRHGYTDDLKLLVDHRDQLHSERTRCANRLHAHLAIAHPGYQRHIGKSLDTRRALAHVEELLNDGPSVRADLARWQLNRIRELDTELKLIERHLEALVTETGTQLTSIVGISNITAARILGEVGDVRRFPTPAAFAAANGSAPIPVSSGRTDRHRLNRGGNRRLNRALYVIAITQTRHEPRAVDYLARKRAEGKTRREALRCLKRRLSDVVYRELQRDLTTALDT